MTRFFRFLAGSMIAVMVGTLTLFSGVEPAAADNTSDAAQFRDFVGAANVNGQNMDDFYSRLASNPGFWAGMFADYTLVHGTLTNLPSTSTGTVSLMTDWQWPMHTSGNWPTNGQSLSIAITGQTLIFGHLWQTLPLAEVMNGDAAYVVLHRVSDSQFEASVIKETSSSTATMKRGSITSIDRAAQMFTLAQSGNQSLTIYVGSSTNFTDGTNGARLFSDLAIGQTITAQGTTDTATGKFTATSVKIENYSPTPQPTNTVTERGFITKLSNGNGFTLSSPQGFTVTLGNNATIIGPNGRNLTWNDLSTGNLVDVRGMRTSDLRGLTADKVTVLYYEAPDQAVTLHGHIAELNHPYYPSQLTLNVAQVTNPDGSMSSTSAPVTVLLAGTTVMSGNTTTSTLSSLQPNDHIQIKGWLQRDGMIYADYISYLNETN